MLLAGQVTALMGKPQPSGCWERDGPMDVTIKQIYTDITTKICEGRG